MREHGPVGESRKGLCEDMTSRSEDTTDKSASERTSREEESRRRPDSSTIEAELGRSSMKRSIPAVRARDEIASSSELVTSTGLPSSEPSMAFERDLDGNESFEGKEGRPELCQKARLRNGRRKGEVVWYIIRRYTAVSLDEKTSAGKSMVTKVRRTQIEEDPKRSSLVSRSTTRSEVGDLSLDGGYL
jgi:hypothetical protein